MRYKGGSEAVGFGAYRICAQASLKTHADILSGTRGLEFSLNLNLHSNLAYASIEGSGESAYLKRLVWTMRLVLKAPALD